MVTATADDLLSVVGDGLELRAEEERLLVDAFSDLTADLGDSQVRAEVLRRLFLHADMVRGGQPGRFRFIGGRLEGDLDLTGLRLDFAMRFEDTDMDGLLLADARIVSLELLGCTAERIEADRAEIAHDLVLTKRFECRGRTLLRSASVGGDVNCGGGRFLGGGGASLILDGARIRGRLYLRKEGDNRFQASGGVLVRNARIAGGVLCTSGIFEREVEFSRTQVLGTFSLSFADIGRRPRNPGGEPDARLRLDSMHIASELSLKWTDYHGPEIDLARTRVEGRMRWSLKRTDPAANALGVDLMQAHVRHLHDDLNRWHGARIRLDGFSFEGVAVRGKDKDWLEKRKSWLDQQPPKKWSPCPYDQTHAALQSSGYGKLARSIAVEREAVRLGKGGLSRIDKAIHWLYGQLFGYGYKPVRFFFIAALVVLAFSIPFSAIDTCDRAVKAASCGGFGFPSTSAPDYHAPLFSLDAFVPADLGQTAAWSPNATVYSYLIAIETSLGWLFTGLLVGAVAGILRRD